MDDPNVISVGATRSAADALDRLVSLFTGMVEARDALVAVTVAEQQLADRRRLSASLARQIEELKPQVEAATATIAQAQAARTRAADEIAAETAQQRATAEESRRVMLEDAAADAAAILQKAHDDAAAVVENARAEAVALKHEAEESARAEEKRAAQAQADEAKAIAATKLAQQQLEEINKRIEAARQAARAAFGG